MSKYGQVIPARRYRTPDGQSVSLYSSYVPPGSKLETVGWTISWYDGTSGIGRAPFKTEQEAQDWLDRNPNFRGMSAFTY